MTQVQVQRQSGAFGVFRVIIVCEAIVFLVAAALHTGAFGVSQLIPAMIVEGLCGLGCVLSAYAMFTRKRWAKKNALIVQILVLLGVLLGVVALMRSPGLDTPLNVGLHAVMFLLIVLGLALLALPNTRVGFSGQKL